jgi:hypothetical protein
MCTVSWFRRKDGYELFFNRDERRTRRPAEPPDLRRHGNTPFLAPLDGDFGGSWLAANEHGLALALLNGYAANEPLVESPGGDYTSRGLLLISLVDARSAEQAVRRLTRRELGRFRSFLLLALDPSGGGRLATWSGGELTFDDEIEERSPLVSSAFDTEAVRRSRRELFLGMRGDHEGDPLPLHLSYHESHLPERGPRSVCMHRPDARTVSFSRVTVDARDVLFYYSPASPCRGRPTAPAAGLARSTPAARKQSGPGR